MLSKIYSYLSKINIQVFLIIFLLVNSLVLFDQKVAFASNNTIDLNTCKARLDAMARNENSYKDLERCLKFVREKNICILADGLASDIPFSSDIYGVQRCSGDLTRNRSWYREEDAIIPMSLKTSDWQTESEEGSSDFKTLSRLQALSGRKAEVFRKILNNLKEQGLLNNDELNKKAEEYNKNGGVTLAKDDKDKDKENAGYTCNIPSKLSWLICPPLTAVTNSVDYAMEMVRSMLKLEQGQGDNTESIIGVRNTSSNKAIYSAWAGFRDIANIIFVIIFLLIVISHITGGTLSAYTIKTMLPRVILGAILINLSYYICQIAVDLSNILGVALKDFFDQLTSSMHLAETSPKAIGSNVLSGATGVGAVVVSAIAVAILVLCNLGALLAVVLTILMLLIARKALVLFLVIVSPIAFASYMLPSLKNGIFNPWLKIFKSMLLVYPIVSVVWGASKLASAILGGASGDTIEGSLVAIAVLTIPPISILPLMKSAMSALTMANLGTMAERASHRLKGWRPSSVEQVQKHVTGGLSEWRAGVAAGAVGSRLAPTAGLRSWVNAKSVTGRQIEAKQFLDSQKARGVNIGAITGKSVSEIGEIGQARLLRQAYAQNTKDDDVKAYWLADTNKDRRKIFNKMRKDQKDEIKNARLDTAYVDPRAAFALGTKHGAHTNELSNNAKRAPIDLGRYATGQYEMERAVKMSSKESSVNTPSIESKEIAQNIVTTPIEKETAGSVEAKEAQNKFSKLEDLNEVRLKNNSSKELKINHDPNHADNMHKF